MAKFIIHTHQRLQEWVAEEKGYFRAEGLNDYELRPNRLPIDPKVVAAAAARPDLTPDNLMGAFQSYEQGREASVSCACHWTVNMAASNEHGRMWGECYSVSPGGIFVPPDSPIRRPEDLAGVEVHVGYQSGSHYTTIQSLEPFLSAEQIKLKFGGQPVDRVDQLLDGRARAATVFGVQYYLVEQLGYRKILDCTFMIAGMVPQGADIEDVRRYYRALRRAQADLDLMFQPYAHYYANELPAHHAKLVDVRRFGPGERLVFEPYTQQMYEATRAWVNARSIFPEEKKGRDVYERAVVTAQAAE
jgi:hypothetical protein